MTDEVREVTLADCPPGLFRFKGTLGFKTEYGAMEVAGPTNIPGHEMRWTVGNHPDAYCLDSGEYFWGGAASREERDAIMVEPVDLSDLSQPKGGDAEAVAWLERADTLKTDIFLYFADQGVLLGHTMPELDPAADRWSLEEHLLIRAQQMLAAALAHPPQPKAPELDREKVAALIADNEAYADTVMPAHRYRLAHIIADAILSSIAPDREGGAG